MENTHTTSRVSPLHSSGEARLIHMVTRAGGWKKEVKQLGKEYGELNQEREGKAPEQKKALREQMNARIERAREALREPMKRGMRLDAVRTGGEARAMVLRAWARNIQERAKVLQPPFHVVLEYVEGEGVVITPEQGSIDWDKGKGDKQRIIDCANLPEHNIQCEDRGASLVVQIRGYDPERGYIGMEQAEQPAVAASKSAPEVVPEKSVVGEAPEAAPAVSPAVEDAIKKGATVVGSGISEASKAPEKIVGTVSGLIDSLKGGDKSVEAAPEQTYEMYKEETEAALQAAKDRDAACEVKGYQGGNLQRAINAYRKYITVAEAEGEAIRTRFNDETEGRVRLEEDLPQGIAAAKARLEELRAFKKENRARGASAVPAPAPEAAPKPEGPVLIDPNTGKSVEEVVPAAAPEVQLLQPTLEGVEGVAYAVAEDIETNLDNYSREQLIRTREYIQEEYDRFLPLADQEGIDRGKLDDALASLVRSKNAADKRIAELAPAAAPAVSPAVEDAIQKGAKVVGSGISEASKAPEKIVGTVSGLIDSLKGGDKSVEAAPEQTKGSVALAPKIEGTAATPLEEVPERDRKTTPKAAKKPKAAPVSAPKTAKKPKESSAARAVQSIIDTVKGMERVSVAGEFLDTMQDRENATATLRALKAVTIPEGYTVRVSIVSDVDHNGKEMTIDMADVKNHDAPTLQKSLDATAAAAPEVQSIVDTAKGIERVSVAVSLLDTMQDRANATATLRALKAVTIPEGYTVRVSVVSDVDHGTKEMTIDMEDVKNHNAPTLQKRLNRLLEE
ncbi:MAG: hypothetical protein PHU04_05005 [Candidatus Peribacteraceae bacterium]|nr:hypothetical protein [Candidatus Peribacteraceae bacterium]